MPLRFSREWLDLTFTSSKLTDSNTDRNRAVFTARLPDELANKLRHYMIDQQVTASKAINTILSKFFYNTRDDQSTI